MSESRSLKKPLTINPPVARLIVTSSSNRVRIEKAIKHLASHLGGSEVLLVAPTRGAADDFAREYSFRHGALFGVHRTTLTGLVANLATEPLATQNLAPVTRLGTEALAARSIHSCRGQLAYFGPVADTPGFPRALASTISELRMEGIDRRALAESGVGGRDLSLLLDCYERELRSRSLADYAVMCASASQVAQSGAHRLLGVPLLLLDVIPDSTAEKAVLRAVTARAASVFATALAEDQDAVRILEEIFETRAQRLPDDPQEKSLDRLRESIFSPSLASSERLKLDGSVDFFSAPGEALECVEIARRIRSAGDNSHNVNGRKTSVAFDQIAILLRNPNAYLPLVEDALRRAGIEDTSLEALSGPILPGVHFWPCWRAPKKDLPRRALRSICPSAKYPLSLNRARRRSLRLRNCSSLQKTNSSSASDFRVQRVLQAQAVWRNRRSSRDMGF